MRRLLSIKNAKNLPKIRIWDESEKILQEKNALLKLNSFFFEKTRILSFFSSISDFFKFREFCTKYSFSRKIPKEFGDFQTPTDLTDKICQKLLQMGFNPDIIIEPMCGMGNFVVSALNNFQNISQVFALDIQEQYSWLFRWNILTQTQVSNYSNDLQIHFFLSNFFEFDFTTLLKPFRNNSILILGNPPWITTSELSRLDSSNIPQKSNIKKFHGLDAITGKSNFDIAENMIMTLLQIFSQQILAENCTIAMLCKTSVMRNIIRDIKKVGISIEDAQCLLIDSKKEFNVSVDAGLFILQINSYSLGKISENQCKVSSFYQNLSNSNILYTYGYVNHRFIADVQDYQLISYLDGKSSLIWRQGVKHDAVKVFEITKITKHSESIGSNTNIPSTKYIKKIGDQASYKNGYNQIINLEEQMVYPLIKSSDIQKKLIDSARKMVIITQNKIGQDTNYIEHQFPLLWNYLKTFETRIDNRKSRVYHNKPPFSIFGIGSYAFAPYKVGISGFYKNPQFALILPINNKPAMLDDTCYYLSFETLKEAGLFWLILNSDLIQSFLKVITFAEAKRPFTKEKLMHINFQAVFKTITLNQLEVTWNLLKSEIFPKNMPISFIKIQEEFLKQKKKFLK
ncbi:MAG: hypothetical protein ACTSWC_02580 [Promethearchaeota archaeon]